jgi:hypothetical protein
MMIAGVVLVAFAAYYGEVETSTDSEPAFPLSQAFAPDGTRNPHPATLLVRRPSKAQWNELAAMLRPACLDHVGGGSALIAIGPDENAVPSVLLADSGQLCCNDCHRRAASEPSHEAMSLQIAMACSACHKL